MFKRRCIGLLTLIGATLAVSAQEAVRPVASTWTVEVGTSHIADTYLSPIKYSGMHYGLTYNRLQAMKTLPAVQGWNLGVVFDCASNQVKNATMLELRIDGSWRMMRRWQLANGFSLGVGGNVDAQLGALYLSRNGNNPVQAIAALTVGPEAFAQWAGKLGSLPIAVRWQASTPIVGGFFCPDYGELYYEISLGNHSDLVHFAHPGSYRKIDSMLSLDLNFGKTTLRLGYRLNARSSQANNITSRNIEHSAVVGVVCDFITINPRKNDAQVITAYY